MAVVVTNKPRFDFKTRARKATLAYHGLRVCRSAPKNLLRTFLYYLEFSNEFVTYYRINCSLETYTTQQHFYPIHMEFQSQFFPQRIGISVVCQLRYGRQSYRSIPTYLPNRY